VLGVRIVTVSRMELLEPFCEFAFRKREELILAQGGAREERWDWRRG
jgi:hypothetical protein